ncbi:General transcription factor 3C polypeptide 2 [Spatholobus suberectus]|nr:General transcription factor 3C polypeptide 2 [Spatholobus suberectus]
MGLITFFTPYILILEIISFFTRSLNSSMTTKKFAQGNQTVENGRTLTLEFDRKQQLIWFKRLATKAVETDHACNRFPHFLCASVTEEDSTIIIHTPFLWKKPQDKGQYAESFRDLSSKSNPSKSANNQMAETSNSDEALCHPYLSSCQIHHASNSFLFV